MIPAQWFAAVEAAVLSSTPATSTAAPPLPDLDIIDTDDFSAPEYAAGGSQLMSHDAWGMQWRAMHSAADVAIWMRCGQSPGLSELADGESGTAAARATYDLISRYPALAAILLDPAGSAWAGGIAILAHLMVCTHTVKSVVSASQAAQEAHSAPKTAQEAHSGPEAATAPQSATETAQEAAA